MSTIKDIARLAGVSKSTVSRVVSNNGVVKPETREKIERAMKEANYTPNMFAKGMRTNKSFSIGILFPDLSNPYLTEWYEIVDRIAQEKGYLNYICITDPKGTTEEKRLDDLLARNIDGVILFSYCKNDAFVKKMLEVSKTTPIICSDSMFEDTGLSCVFADGEEGTKTAIDYLFESGRKRIAYIKGEEPFKVVERRYNGYCKSLQSHGIQQDENLIYAGQFKKECGFKAAEKFMSLPNPPDAIATSTDDMAVGALEYLVKKGYKVPEDVAVVGFNNQEVTKITTPALSTVALPIQQLAETAIKTLVRLIDNPEQAPVKHIVNCELKLRKTT